MSADNRHTAKPHGVFAEARSKDASGKKIPETDAIFDNVQTSRERALKEPNTLRISLDTKAKVKVCEFSRGGSARTVKPIRALDHDIRPDGLMVPFGILELNRGTHEIHQPWVAFGHSKETSDFMADAIVMWWAERRLTHAGVTKLQIELDNGPEINSSRTQFMKRMVALIDQMALEIELVYLPPYHSKYNPIERFWGVLEQHWNGTLLSSVQIVINWARTATWRDVSPIVRQIKQTYNTGVTIGRTAFREIKARLKHHQTLPRWSLIIKTITVD